MRAIFFSAFSLGVSASFRTEMLKVNLQFFRVAFCLLPLAACVALSGCTKSGPTMHAVRGTLTHNGEPIPEMLICFHPVNADVNPASEATTDAEGKFELKVGKTVGVMPGEYHVYVLDPIGIQGGTTSTEESYQTVLKKYGSREKSDIKITIDAAKYDYELKLD